MYSTKIFYLVFGGRCNMDRCSDNLTLISYRKGVVRCYMRKGPRRCIVDIAFICEIKQMF